MSKRKEKLKRKVEHELDVLEQALRVERDKRLLMYAGVTFFMVLFIGLWLVNFTVAVKESQPAMASGPTISEMLDKFKTDFKEAALATSSQTVVASGQTTESPVLNAGLDQAKLQVLKAKIEEQLIATGSQGKLPVSK